jgi:hypothetical protein
MKDLCSFPEFVALLKSFDASMMDNDLRFHYLVPKYGADGTEDRPWDLQVECYYHLRFYRDPAVNECLTKILTTADVLLMDVKGHFNPITVEALKDEGYCVSRIVGGPLNSWSLAQLTGRNFSLYFG